MTSSSPVWITGVAGFIGINLAQSLISDGVKVIGFGHRAEEDVSTLCQGLSAYYGGGISQATLMAAKKAHGMPQKVFHLAGGATVGGSFADPLKDFEKNVGSASHILNFMGVHMRTPALFISSSAAIFGDGYTGEIMPDDALNPLSPYGAHKVAMENMARVYAQCFGLKIGIVRLFSVYGRELRKQLLWDACTRLQNGENPLRLGGTGRECRDWCHITDIVRYFRTVDVPRAGQCLIKNAGTSIPTQVETLAELLVKNWPDPVTIEFSQERRNGDPFSLLAALDQDMNFTWNMSVAEGVADYVEWFLKETAIEKSSVGH